VRCGRVDFGDERGIAATIVAISMLFVVGILALAIDGGMLLVQRRHIVNGADAAALAAAEAYARNEAQCGTNDGPAKSQADSIATSNMATASEDSYATDCTKQTVNVAYHADVQAMFMGAVGLGSTHAVKARAIGAWGTSSGATNLLPFMLDLGQVTTQCGAPNPALGAPCVLWYTNDNAATSQWGVLNLCSQDAYSKGGCNSVGWDVGSGASGCNSTGSSVNQDWVQNGFPYALTMHSPPPTYVCVIPGFGSMNTASGFLIPGVQRIFPVNDPNLMVLDNKGNPYKYAIVGFTALKILAVGKGNNAETTCGQTKPPWVKNLSNAVCLKVQWIGPVEVPGGITTGQQNFGVYAIALQG